MNLLKIKNAQPKDILRDSQVPGLHLRVFDTKRSFYLYFRTKTGLERRPKLGDFPTITLDQARKIARDMLFQVGMGQDPMAERQKVKESPTVAEAFKKYMLEHAPTKKTGEQDKWVFDNHVPTSFQRKRVIDIKYQDIYDLHQGMKETPYMANRLKSILSKFMSLCERWGYRPDGANPCQHVEGFKESKRKRYMKGEEAARISEILNREKVNNPKEVAHIYLMMLTGARRGEIGEAKWGQLIGNRLILTEHKTDRTGEDRVVRLPAAAMEIIKELPRRGDDDLIIGGKKPNDFWNKVRKEAGCPDLRLHDLRHSFASMAISAGYTLAQIGELLGHNSSNTTKRYAHLMDEAAEAAADSVGDAINATLTRQTATT